MSNFPYYDNFQQVRYYNSYSGEWRTGICHHDWLLDYSGEAYKLDYSFFRDNDPDDVIIERSWRNLKEIDLQ